MYRGKILEGSRRLTNSFSDFHTADGVDLKDDEAREIRGKTIEKDGGWWLVGIDVFHQIHCLVRGQFQRHQLIAKLIKCRM